MYYERRNTIFLLLGDKVHFIAPCGVNKSIFLSPTRRKIVEVILLNFRSNLGHKDKLEVI